MEHEQHHEGGDRQPDTSPEQAPDFAPRIHVIADLDSTRHGIEHGLWIDATQVPEILEADIAAMLDSAPTAATEWSIDDSEDFGGLDLTTTTDTSLISQLARGVVAHGHAFAVWTTLIAPDREQLDHFAHAYVGSYATPEAWAHSLADRLGWHDVLDKAVTDPLLKPYVVLDYTAIAEDSDQHWHLATGADGRTHVFVK